MFAFNCTYPVTKKQAKEQNLHCCLDMIVVILFPGVRYSSPVYSLVLHLFVLLSMHSFIPLLVPSFPIMSIFFISLCSEFISFVYVVFFSLLSWLFPSFANLHELGSNYVWTWIQMQCISIIQYSTASDRTRNNNILPWRQIWDRLREVRNSQNMTGLFNVMLLLEYTLFVALMEYIGKR